MLVALSACSGTSPGTSPAQSGTGAKPSGDLTIAQSFSGGEVMDPSLNSPLGSKFLPMYEFLIGANTKGELSKDLGLAKDWKVVHTATQSTYTITMRKGVKWHDGSEVTSADAKFSIEYFMRPKSQAGRADFFRKTIKQMETPDADTLVVQTLKPYGGLLLDLSRLQTQEGIVLPKQYIEKNGEEYFNKNPIGSGPFKFKERVQGSSMTFEAVDYPHWLYGVPKYQRLIFKFVGEESTRVAMLKNKEADVIDLSRGRKNEIESAGLKFIAQPGGQFIAVWMGNTWQKDTYLSDPRVREALNLAVDQKAILQHILGGMGAVTSTAPYYGDWSYGYQGLPLYPYDPKRAKTLLAEAFPKGIKLTFNSFPRPGVGEMTQLNEAVATMWKEAFGDLIDIKIVPMADFAVHRALEMAGNIPNTVFGITIPDRSLWSQTWRLYYHSTGQLTLTKDPKLDSMLNALENEMDIDKAGKMQYDIAKYLKDNFYAVPLASVGATFAANAQKVGSWDMGRYVSDWNYLDLVKR